MTIYNIKGFCTYLLGGNGKEIGIKRRLCWAPIFSLARLWNKRFSTFSEYNYRFFLLGSSLVQEKDIPVRCKIAVIISRL